MKWILNIYSKFVHQYFVSNENIAIFLIEHRYVLDMKTLVVMRKERSRNPFSFFIILYRFSLFATLSFTIAVKYGNYVQFPAGKIYVGIMSTTEIHTVLYDLSLNTDQLAFLPHRARPWVSGFGFSKASTRFAYPISTENVKPERVTYANAMLITRGGWRLSITDLARANFLI